MPEGEHCCLRFVPQCTSQCPLARTSRSPTRVHTLFVPFGLTGHLQPCDLALCQHFKQQVGGLCASHFAELVTAAIEQFDEDEKRVNPVAVDTRLSVVKGLFTRWVNDVVTSVLAAVHARAWKHLMPANQEWSDVVAANHLGFYSTIATRSLSLLAPLPQIHMFLLLVVVALGSVKDICHALATVLGSTQAPLPTWRGKLDCFYMPFLAIGSILATVSSTFPVFSVWHCVFFLAPSFRCHREIFHAGLALAQEGVRGSFSTSPFSLWHSRISVLCSCRSHTAPPFIVDADKPVWNVTERDYLENIVLFAFALLLTFSICVAFSPSGVHI